MFSNMMMELKYTSPLEREKKNNLDSGLQAEINNDNEYNEEQQITITSAFALLPNPGKDLQMMELISPIVINLQPFVMESWTLLVTEKDSDHHHSFMAVPA